MLGDLGTYVDLAKRVKDPQAAERLTPEIIAALVTGVADSRTKSDRGQAGILGSRQARDAADALTGMTQKDYAKTMTLLLGTEIADPGRDTAKADPAVERALLLKAVAARRDDYHVSILERIRMMGIPVPGHGTPPERTQANADIARFAEDIRGMNREDLINLTALTDIDNKNTSKINPTNQLSRNDTDPSNDGGWQAYTTSCSTSSAQIIKAEADPIYAQKLNKESSSNISINNSTIAMEQKKFLELDNQDEEAGVALPRVGEKVDQLVKWWCQQGAPPDWLPTRDLKKFQENFARLNKNNEPQQPLAKASLSKQQCALLRDCFISPNFSLCKKNEVWQSIEDLLKAICLGPNSTCVTQPDLRATSELYDSSAAMKEGRGKGLYYPLNEISKPATHIDYANTVKIKESMPEIDKSLKDGQIVPFYSAGENDTDGHMMLLTDIRKEKGKIRYLIHDPWTGRTRTVSYEDLAAGHFRTDDFGLGMNCSSGASSDKASSNNKNSSPCTRNIVEVFLDRKQVDNIDHRPNA